MTKGSTVAGALPFGHRLHEYEFLHVLGHGGFGITYLARDCNVGRTVAVKEYLPRELAVRGADYEVEVRADDCREAFDWGLQQFLKEARVLGRFSHPNVIRIYRYFEAHGTAYIVMEYAEGVSLEEVLRREETLSEQRLLAVLAPLLNGLEQVHRAGVLHRDIKPANIIVRRNGEPVMIDFGAARLDLGSRTQSVLSMMTAGYAPIEQYATEGQQGPWTDLYALAAVGYRALSGRRPTDAVNRVREDPLVPAVLAGQGRYAPALLQALDWALSVNPEDRPRSIAQWRLAVQGEMTPPTRVTAPASTAQESAGETELLPAATASVEPTQALTRMASAKVRRTGAFTIAAVALSAAVLATGGGLLWWSVQDPETDSAQASTAQDSDSIKSTTVSTKPKEPSRSAPRTKPAEPAGPRPIARMRALQDFRDCRDCPRMVVLAGGRFSMGAAPGPGTNRWEIPAREVRLSRPFAVATTEVTGREWQACVRAGACASAHAEAPTHPVTGVNWSEARAYAAWLTKSTGRRYRLPSEAEWEYALRAGTTQSRFWGDSREGQCAFANAADLASLPVLGRDTAHIDCNDGNARIAPVGRYQANRFGLHDMAGNVWEWTLDCWRDSYAGAPTDGSSVTSAGCERRVIRGGSWRTKPESLRSAARGWSPVAHRSDDLGLRVVAE